MALDANIRGATTGLGAEVNASNQLKVVTETNAATNPGNVGTIRIFSENDAGSIVGTAQLKSPETSQDYRLRVGMDSVLFNESFNYTTQNTYNWAYSTSTLTAALPGAGTLNFSAVQGTTSAHGAFMRTYQYFPIVGTAPLSIEFTFGQFTAALVTNEVFAAGLGLPASPNALPTDGIFVQLTSAGLIGVAAYNGSTTQTGTLLDINSITVGNLYKLAIVVGEQEVEFWWDDVLLGNLALPAANGQPFLSTNLPVFMQKFNTGAVSNTNTVRVSDVVVSLYDIQAQRSSALAAAVAGQSAHVTQNGFGSTYTYTQATGTVTTGSTPLLPTSAAGSNTAANVTGLGGWGAINAAAGAATDFIATSYQNPAGTINITGRNLIIQGVRISTINTGAAVATTPTTLLWSVAFGHTAVSLQTLETASFAANTTHAPRRVQLGFQTAPVGAAIGARYTDDLFMPFTAPIVVRPGEFIATIMKIVVGTATASQTITFNVVFDGYWE